MKHIPYFSFDAMNKTIDKAMLNAYKNVFKSKWYILGNRVIKFEKEYAKFNQVKSCVGVANGLDALIISLKILQIGPGDEVLVPSNTYIATWLAVSAVGARVIPVEPKLETYNIDPLQIERHITKRTRAIIPVHLYGQCCEMEPILKIAKKYNLFVIEDNAQSQGSTYKGKFAGSYGHINGTSFYPGKNIGALGDSGAITTNFDKYSKMARILRNYGSNNKYYNEVKGLNSRLDELQAAFLSVKLKHLNKWNIKRNGIAKQYSTRLGGVGDLVLPLIAQDCTSTFHVYLIRTAQRDRLKKYLDSMGIKTLIHYPIPPHLQKAYKEYGYKIGDMPIAEKIASTCLSLPIYPGLTTATIDYICENILGFFYKETH